MGTAKAYMNVEPRIAYSDGAEANVLRNLVTIGFNGVALTEILNGEGYNEISYVNVGDFVTAQSKLSVKPQVDAVLCSDDLHDNHIKELVKFMHGSELLLSVPIVLFSNRSNVKSRKDIFSLGLDDIFDESTDLTLFYERIDLIKRTKERLSEDPEDRLILSMANIDININIFKRVGDVAISLLMLIVLSPLFIIVALLIKLESKGPVFYTSKRAGAGYKIFDFYKFRSMAQGADEEMSKVLHLNQYDASKSDSNSVFYKIKGDPRVTKIGAFLRKTSIDELPQLINVLKGDMSLVGNRPLPLYEAQQLTRDNWVARFNAPAGITGLWQISKRGKAEMSEEERVQLDVEYSKKHSFWYDLWILVSTVPVIFQEDDV